MEGVRSFLESSTIHGLGYISTTRKCVKLFWILIVITGFTGASVIIYQSFQDWSDNPVTTTIETRPITELTFPKVTVCPPKNTFTDLNYDLKNVENMTIEKDAQNELTMHANELLYDQFYSTMMTDMRLLEYDQRYFNWYYGYDKLSPPEYTMVKSYGVVYKVYTGAISGTVSTQFFGDKYDVDKVRPRVFLYVEVIPPRSISKNANVTLNYNIKKIRLNDLTGREYYYGQIKSTKLNPPGTKGPRGGTSSGINLKRVYSLKDVKKQKLTLMPGFKLDWNYSGMEGMELQPDDSFANKHTTKLFVRNI